MKFVYIFILASLFIFSISCSKKSSDQPIHSIHAIDSFTQDLPLFRFSTTACFGFCPIFEIEVDQKGHLNLLGKRFTYPCGAFEGEMSDADKKRYYDLVHRIDWDTVPERYESMVADAQGFHFKFADSIKTFGDYGMPETLDSLKIFFINLEQTVHWNALDSIPGYSIIQENNAALVHFIEDPDVAQIQKEFAFLKNSRFSLADMNKKIWLIQIFNSDLDYDALKKYLLNISSVDKVEPYMTLKKKLKSPVQNGQ